MTQRQTLAAIRALGLGADIHAGVITVSTRLPYRSKWPCWSVTGLDFNRYGNVVYTSRNRQDAIQTAHFIATRLPVVCRPSLLG